VAHYAKPIFLAEVGVEGSVEYMEKWFVDLGERFRNRFPLVSGIIYFNEREPHQLPEPFGAPDWRLGAKYFSHMRH
jgi:endoglucanase